MPLCFNSKAQRVCLIDDSQFQVDYLSLPVFKRPYSIAPDKSVVKGESDTDFDSPAVLRVPEKIATSKATVHPVLKSGLRTQWLTF